MSELKIDLDYARLAEAWRGPREESKPWWHAEKLLPWVQLIAIVGAAVWGLYLFVKFQKQQSELTTVIAGFTAKQSELTLASSRLDLNKKTSRQLEYSCDLSVFFTGTKTAMTEDIYKVSFRYKAVNKSDTPLTLTFVTFELFQATQPPASAVDAIELNPGNDPTGSIKWKTLSTRVYCRHEDMATHPRINTTAGKTKNEDIIEDAGGTAQLNPGESSDCEWIFLVTGKRTDWINTVLHVAAHDGKNPDDISRFIQIKSLMEAKPLSAQNTPTGSESE